MIAYGPDTPLVIAHLVRITEANPTHWEGVTEHYADVTVRVRRGELRVQVGSTWNDWRPDNLWEWTHRLDGTVSRLTDAELRAALPEWVALAGEAPA